MASYPTISTLPGLTTTPGLTNPADTDPAAELAASVRQLKGFLATYLAEAHDDTGLLKPGATSADSIADRSITAAKIELLAITAAEIANATITSGKIANSAITTALLDDLAVTTGKIAAGAVTTAKLDTGAVTANELGAGAVTEGKIGSGAVTSTKLGASAVGNAALAANAVSKDKLGNVGEGRILVGDGTAMESCTVGGALTLVRSGTVASFQITGGASSSALVFAKFVETGVSGTSGGATTANTWENRAVTAGWDKSGGDPAGLLGTFVGYRFRLDEGEYFIRATIPGYSCGSFRTLLMEDPVGTPAPLIYGSNAVAPAGSLGVSFLSGLFSVSDDSTEYSFQQYSEFAETHGMGLPQSIALLNEIYTTVELIKYA